MEETPTNIDFFTNFVLRVGSANWWRGKVNRTYLFFFVQRLGHVSLRKNYFVYLSPIVTRLINKQKSRQKH